MHLKQNNVIKDYTQAIKLNPKDPWGYYNRAIVYHKVRQYKETIKDYTHAIKLTSKTKQGEIFRARGAVYFHLKDYRKAIKDFDNALKRNGRTDVYAMKGAALYALNKKNEAQKAVDADKRWAGEFEKIKRVYNLSDDFIVVMRELCKELDILDTIPDEK
ncbi:MAG: tetratricopeptide repeat protein [bacterium]